MDYSDYKKLLETEKICWFCGNGHSSKKYRFYTKHYQGKFWVCSACLKQIGSTVKVIEELEKIEIPYDCLNYSKQRGGK